MGALGSSGPWEDTREALGKLLRSLRNVCPGLFGSKAEPEESTDGERKRGLESERKCQQGLGPSGLGVRDVSRSGGMLCSFLGQRLSLLTCLAEPPLSPQGVIQGQQRQPLLGACWKCSTSGSAYSKIPGESHSKKHWPRLDPHISWNSQPQIRFIQVTWRVLSRVHTTFWKGVVSATPTIAWQPPPPWGS